MQHVDWASASFSLVDALSNINSNAGHDLCLRSGPVAFDRPVHMPAQQANHLAVTIEADIVKQKQATCNGGFEAIGFGKTHPKVYKDLTSDNPIDLVRYQVANCYMGRIGMINSGGPSGQDDLHQAIRTAVINKRAGGMGLISGRKACQKPMDEGVKLLNAIQDVYLSSDVSIA